MAVAFLNKSSSVNSGQRTSATVEHIIAVSASNRALVVCVLLDSTGNSADISGITYDSVALTKQVDVDQTTIGDTFQIWTMAAPNTGTHDVVVSYSGGNKDYDAVFVTSYTGVNQVDHLGAVASTERDDSQNANVSITTDTANSMIVGGAVAWSGTGGDTVTFTGDNSESERYDTQTGTTYPGDADIWIADVIRASASAGNFGATVSSTDSFPEVVVGAIELHESDSATSTTTSNTSTSSTTTSGTSSSSSTSTTTSGTSSSSSTSTSSSTTTTAVPSPYMYPEVVLEKFKPLLAIRTNEELV